MELKKLIKQKKKKKKVSKTDLLQCFGIYAEFIINATSLSLGSRNGKDAIR